ncbi:MAG: thiamine phosphate synthase, partial [Methanomassiliicoccaceae archaeon]|nr:thiamine phosphate synthase [Methanomassiliicoccaceae archaeon]
MMFRQTVRHHLTLYLVTDSTGTEEDVFLNIIEKACAGGVTMVQLREKERTGREYLDLALKVKRITDRCSIPLIIDDRADIARAADAAGVHVGKDDIPVRDARRILGNEKM